MVAITAIILNHMASPSGHPARLRPEILRPELRGSSLQQVQNYIAYNIGWMVEKRGGGGQKTDTAVAYIQLDTMQLNCI
jgi:hypothetical protein